MTFKAPQAQAATVAIATFLGLTLGTVQQAHAGIITSSSTGLTNPARTITFDNPTFPNGTVITDQYSNLGVTFSNGLYFAPQGDFGFPNIDANHLANFTPDGETIVSPIFINFNQAQSGAAFAFATNPGVSTLTALYKGALVETFNADASTFPINNYFGFSDIQFDQIQINAASNGAFLLDNLQLSNAEVAPVPELSTMTLMLIAMVTLMGAAWMRKKKEDAIYAPLHVPADMA